MLAWGFFIWGLGALTLLALAVVGAHVLIAVLKGRKTDPGTVGAAGVR